MARKPFLIDQQQVGHMLDVDSRTVQSWSKRAASPLPIAEPGKRGQPHRYNPQEVVRWYVQNEISRMGLADGEVLVLDAERAKLARLQARKVELDLAEREGRLMPPDTLVEFFMNLLMATRSHFLALPNKAAPAVHGCESVAETCEAIREHVYSALTELSEMTPQELMQRAGIEVQGDAGTD